MCRHSVIIITSSLGGLQGLPGYAQTGQSVSYIVLCIKGIHMVYTVDVWYSSASSLTVFSERDVPVAVCLYS